MGPTRKPSDKSLGYFQPALRALAGRADVDWTFATPSQGAVPDVAGAQLPLRQFYETLLRARHRGAEPGVCAAKRIGPRTLLATVSWIVCIGMLLACGNGEIPPLSPEEALETFEVEEGFQVELVAAEPMIRDPVAMEIDERGRIFVVEMPGYPLKPEGTGKIKLLTDENGDGFPDRSSVFADGLNLPTGVMRWKEGILVTDAPDVLYFEDRDGDGRADVRRVMLTGFAASNPQHLLNSPVYGLDNWIYVAHEPAVPAVVFKERFGDRGGPVRFADRTDGPELDQNSRGRNVRFRPDRSQLEILPGASQFGHTFDEWGHHFNVTNGNHVRHEVFAARYLDRNPHLFVTATMQDMSDHGNAARVYPIAENPEHALLTDVGQFTSACGLTRYLGGAFPENLGSLAFVAEPVHNLIHADVWTESGPTFKASRLLEEREFLASTDSWFRPVSFYIGPEGALYVVDYYRRMLEHPEWMSDEFHDLTGPGPEVLYEGSTAGRIYRISPENLRWNGPLVESDLASRSVHDLVRLLENRNIWWRRTAQRLLVDRQDPAAAGLLVELTRRSSSPEARVHALWTLEGLNALDEPLVQKSLEDPAAGVRENAILLSEAFLPGSPGMADRLLRMNADPDGRVRFQLLCTLGDLDTTAAGDVRAQLLFSDIESRWMQLAALSARSVDALQLLKAAVTRFRDEETPGRQEFFDNLAAMIGYSTDGREKAELLKIVSAPAASGGGWWQAAALRGLARGMRGSRREGKEVKLSPDALLTFYRSPLAPLREASLDLLELTGLSESPATAAALDEASQLAANPEIEPQRRVDALRLLALSKQRNEESLFKSLLAPAVPESVQVAAVRALGQRRTAETGRFLLENLKNMTPAVRTEAVVGLLRQPEMVHRLLNQVEQGTLPLWTITSFQRTRLVLYPDAGIRTRVQALLRENQRAREEVLARYSPALEEQGDVGRGAKVFASVCQRCHQMEGAGGELGPDLATIRNRGARQLLEEILMPSRSIAQGYEVYVIHLKEGGQLDGVIAGQTPSAITLRQVEGSGQSLKFQEVVIPRENIERIYASTLSAMPENLELEISMPEMADLLAYLRKR